MANSKPAASSVRKYHAGMRAPQHRAFPPENNQPKTGTFCQGFKGRPQMQAERPRMLSPFLPLSQTTPPKDARDAPSMKARKVRMRTRVRNMTSVLSEQPVVGNHMLSRRWVSTGWWSLLVACFRGFGRGLWRASEQVQRPACRGATNFLHTLIFRGKSRKTRRTF